MGEMREGFYLLISQGLNTINPIREILLHRSYHHLVDVDTISCLIFSWLQSKR